MGSAMCTSEARLDGKTAIITGCNTGIGKETAKDFYLRGARVIMACRDVAKATTAKADILQECTGQKNVGQIAVVELDLTSLRSVRLCAKTILEAEDRIDLLINNAGIMLCDKGKTEDGFEVHFGTNHLGHFLLTMLLLPRMCNSTPARIVTVSSLTHSYSQVTLSDLNYNRRRYNRSLAYGQSKLANILFTKELARRIEAANIKGVTAYCLHPGIIVTDIGRSLDDAFCPGTKWAYQNVGKWGMKTPKQGAQTTIYCAVDERCADENGKFYRECGVSMLKPWGKTGPVVCRKLWELSLALVGLETDYNPFVQTQSDAKLDRKITPF